MLEGYSIIDSEPRREMLCEMGLSRSKAMVMKIEGLLWSDFLY